MKNIVIGAGPAGRIGSIELGKLNQETILIERKHIAGTCLNEGCMVICALTDISRHLANQKTYQAHGFIKGEIELDYKLLCDKVKETQQMLRIIEQKQCEDLGIEVIFGEAEINGDMVTVNGESFEYKNLMIATGGKPYIPNIKGSEHGYIHSDLLNLNKIPPKVNIIGSGVISCEIGNILSNFGSEVNIFGRTTFLKELDPSIKDYVVKNLLKNVNIYENTNVNEIRKNSIITEKGEFEGINFICTGRNPNSDIVKDIVDLNPDGGIKVDEMMQTSVSNIYAAGDVTGGQMFTPVARTEGITAARNMAGLSQKVDIKYVPESITLNMPVSFVKRNRNIETETIQIPGVAGPGAFWNLLNRNTGMTKIDINKENKEIENIYSISSASVEGVAYMTLLMRLGMDIEDFDDFLEIHPTSDAVSMIMKYMYNL
ncbi:NAD(P)/FAD-dependent oxidoreductase [uncultured Methanobrevibacter sp.]|uniref:NAD(P)/FAD-dependent oxidoreductase n=1 Tax=uncultured Methanobrevibacter sp. TaxID=253161 RepID=UPI0025D66825|nr:NAD(P)/FAD-dependent oxidoreductase [uncultured Methanobrevibacter sp.]